MTYQTPGMDPGRFSGMSFPSTYGQRRWDPGLGPFPVATTGVRVRFALQNKSLHEVSELLAGLESLLYIGHLLSEKPVRMRSAETLSRLVKVESISMSSPLDLNLLKDILEVAAPTLTLITAWLQFRLDRKMRTKEAEASGSREKQYPIEALASAESEEARKRNEEATRLIHRAMDQLLKDKEESRSRREMAEPHVEPAAKTLAKVEGVSVDL